MNKNKNLVKITARKKIIKNRFRIGENEKEIIRMIGIGVLVLGSIALPNLPLILKPLLKEQGPSGLKLLLKKLIQKKIIYLGGERIELTAKGESLFNEIKISEIVIPQPVKWDGVWHLVSYDIPNNFNTARDRLRASLKRMNFFQIQKSLWVYPYECKEEIAIIAEYMKVAEYVLVMNTDYLPNEEEVEKYFDL